MCENNKPKRSLQREITGPFYFVLVLLLGLFAWQSWCNDCNSSECREEIVNSQYAYLAMQAHKFDAIARLDSLGGDPGLVAEYASQLKKELRADSVAWRSGADVVLRDIKSLLDLHYNNIDRQHSNLMMWAAVLTIVFLVFSFYAIFKIEATLQEAKSKMDALDVEFKRKLDEVEGLQRKANGRMDALDKDVEGKLKEIDAQGKEEINKLIKEAEKQRKKTQLFNDGFDALNKKENDKARDIYLEYIKQYGKEPGVCNNLGNAYLNLQEYEKAIENYKDAIGLNPRNANYYNNLGSAYFNLEDYDKAIEYYDKAIALDAKDCVFYNNRGAAYDRKKDYNRAIDDYLEAIKLNPQYVMAHENLGNAYVKAGDYPKALEAYTEVLKLNPDDKKIAGKIEEAKKKMAAGGGGKE